MALSCSSSSPSLPPHRRAESHDLTEIEVFDSRLRQRTPATSIICILGIDTQGRDMFSALLRGLRTSPAVGVAARVLATMTGTAVGPVAACPVGRWDAVLLRFMDPMPGVPTIVAAVMTLVVFGQGASKVIAALVLMRWAYFPRAGRGTALVETGRDYVEAAHSLGLSPPEGCRPGNPTERPAAPVRHRHDSCRLGHRGGGDSVVPRHRLAIKDPPPGLLTASGYQVPLAGLYRVGVDPGLLIRALALSIDVVGDRLRAATPERLWQRRGDRNAIIFQDPMTTLNPVLTLGTHMVETVRAQRHTFRKEVHAMARDAPT